MPTSTQILAEHKQRMGQINRMQYDLSRIKPQSLCSDREREVTEAYSEWAKHRDSKWLLGCGPTAYVNASLHEDGHDRLTDEEAKAIDKRSATS